MIYKKDSLTSCLWEGTLYDMLKSAIRGHWDKIILDKSRASAHTGVAIRIPLRIPMTKMPKRERIATPVTSVTGSQ